MVNGKKRTDARLVEVLPVLCDEWHCGAAICGSPSFYGFGRDCHGGRIGKLHLELCVSRPSLVP